MDPDTSLEARVATLERSLRRSRMAIAALGLAAFVLTATAFAQQAPSPEAVMEERLSARLQANLTDQAQEQPQAEERVATRRLALTNELNVELVVLQGGTDGSLLVLTPDGREILRLGGPAARRVER